MFDSFGPNKPPAELFLDYGFTDVSERETHRCTLLVELLGPPAGPLNAALLDAIGMQLDGSTFQVKRAIWTDNV